MSGFLGLEKVGGKEQTAKEYGMGLWEDENIQELTVGWLCNSVTMLKAIELDILNGQICMVCELSLNTAVPIRLCLRGARWEGCSCW